MKKLQCEGCGSSDFVKKDGLFECQYCGLKYSPEEISNLYKIRIDNSDKINNLLKLARQAKRKLGSVILCRFFRGRRLQRQKGFPYLLCHFKCTWYDASAYPRHCPRSDRTGECCTWDCSGHLWSDKKAQHRCWHIQFGKLRSVCYKYVICYGK